MSLVKIYCKKCGETSKLDTCGKSREEVEKWLNESNGGFQCFGNHVELGSRADYWTLDWNTVEEGHAPTEEEFIKDLNSKYMEVYENKEIDNFYTVKNFSFGMCVTEDKKTGEEKVFNFVHSPKGTRYYVS